MTREFLMSDTFEGEPQPLGGGALLRLAREQVGVHIAALAVALKVPVRQLEALEQDRLDLLPDHTFARALAGSVCRQLKVDATPILAALPQGGARVVGVGEGLNEPFRPSAPVGGHTWSERLFRAPVLVAVGLLLAALALVFLPVFEGEHEASWVPAASAPAPVASDHIVLEPVTPLLVPSTPALPSSAVPQIAASAARQP